jgi:ATP-binding cassette subfamily B protein/subfamily B ATP-binding cassette protein MsbA
LLCSGYSLPSDRSSRRRFEKFRHAYRQGRSHELVTDEALAQETAQQHERHADPSHRRAYLRKYLRWLLPELRMVVTLVFLALTAAGLEMIQPLFMRHIINEIIMGEGISRADRMASLNMIGVLFLAVVLVARLIEMSRNLLQHLLNVRLLLSLRRALFGQLLGLPLQNLTDMKTGGIISRLSGDIDRTTGLLQLAIISPGVSIVRLLIALGILLAINWQLALMSMAILPPALLLSLTIAKRVRPIYRSIRKENAAIDARVSETFGGIRVVRAFQREIREQLEFLVGRHTIVRKELFAHRRELVLWTSWGFLLAGVNVVIVWLGGYMTISGNASVGDIAAFQWYTLMLLQPVWQIVNSFSELQRSLAGMERVFEVLETPLDKPDRPGAIEAPRQIDEISFEEVNFAYQPGQMVIEDFNLTVPGGSVVALVGRSGAGKTTVTDLLARFHDPTTGRILLNGVDLRDYRLSSYRNLLGVVQQEVFLFDGTIAENIAYGRPHATEAAIYDAARRANALEFIDDLPDGFESRIGERGVKLSGGQAQRLSIARAILADPRLLILDEATSNLDTESEQLIQQSLRDLMQSRTTFVIAHRLSTVAQADLILVLEGGRIVERGTHESLLAARGLYHAMVSRQHSAMQDESLSLR